MSASDAPRPRPRVALLDYGVGNLHSAAKALDRAGAEVLVVPSVAAAEAAGAAALVVPGVGAYRACLEGLGRAAGGSGKREAPTAAPGSQGQPSGQPPVRQAVAAVAAWIAAGRPLLGICVGMQLLFQASEEGPVPDGIGALPGTVRRLGGSGGLKSEALSWASGGSGRPSGSPPVRGGSGGLKSEALSWASGGSGRPSGSPPVSQRPVKVPHIGWDEVTIRPGSRLFAGIADGTRFYFVHSYAPEATGEAVVAVCDYGGPFAAAVERGNLFGTQFHPEKSGAAGHALLRNFVAVAASWAGEQEQHPKGARTAMRGTT